jgi:glutamate-5-semialdehyde dehydrogenase
MHPSKNPSGHPNRHDQVLLELQAAKKAARLLRSSEVSKRNEVLLSLARKLEEYESQILIANQKDTQALGSDSSHAFRDRLLLTAGRLQAMRESLRQVATLPDPLNEVVEQKILSSGITARRVRSALGVIFMIFESRPNVAVEAFSLAFKSGNVICLRGGKESQATVSFLYGLIKESITEAGFPFASMLGITDSSRELVHWLLQQKKWIDVVVPRGGDQLIEFVVENSKIPIIKNDRGLCHVFVNEDAELKTSIEIVRNAKVQRTGVCNAMETLLVHKKNAPLFLPLLYEAIPEVKWFGCPETLKIMGSRPGVEAAKLTSYDTEYLDLIMNVKVVKNLDEAIEHIEIHGSKHSEAILTVNEVHARKFQSEVDAAAVYWNASTRFTDGFEMGLGGELGISTQKLHVRGPVGLKELTSIRWVMDGKGQIRK